MEYRYDTELGPLLERRVTDSHVPATADEQALLEQLDMLLNYFEHVIYLENERHLTKRYRQAVFEYWFELMQAPDRAAIRRYAAWFRFERVAYALDCRTPTTSPCTDPFANTAGSVMSPISLDALSQPDRRSSKANSSIWVTIPA
jgi:hypothetical protein